jgi:16S rRNA (adenine1518-N6/adenine1519-N6)-dimethyltransferase
VDLPLVTPSLARASRERLERFGVRPNRELGQNFLVDDNILDVIGRVAELSQADVVLEIGGGLGILSEYLAAHAAHVHVIETDRRLEPVLRDALDGHPNADLVLGDVMDVDLSALVPPPVKVVANLPYGVAVPAILRTIDQLPQAALWCVMVQREIADRLTASPGSKTFGAPSVLVQLACEVELVRPISRTVFHPVPHVDSALLRMRRRGPAPPEPVRRLVHAAFAHRRKALPRSVEIACGGGRELRDAARAALEGMGHPPDERAERLRPQEFGQLADRLTTWI